MENAQDGDHGERDPHRVLVRVNGAFPDATLERPDVRNVPSDLGDDLVGARAADVLGQLVLERVLEDRRGDGDTEHRAAERVAVSGMEGSIVEGNARCSEEVRHSGRSRHVFRVNRADQSHERDRQDGTVADTLSSSAS